MTLLRLETGDAEVGSDVTVGKGGNLQEIMVSVETGKYPSMGTRGSTQIPKTQETFGAKISLRLFPSTHCNRRDVRGRINSD